MKKTGQRISLAFSGSLFTHALLWALLLGHLGWPGSCNQLSSGGEVPDGIEGTPFVFARPGRGSQGLPESDKKKAQVELDVKNSQGRQQPGGKQGKGQGGLFSFDSNKWADLLKRLDQTEKLGSRYEERFDQLNRSTGAPRPYIYRKRHYEDIVVKDVFPTLEDIHIPFKQQLQKAPSRLKHFQKRNQVIDEYRRFQNGTLPRNRRVVTLQKSGDTIRKGPLRFNEEERKKYFDKTINVSKEQQLLEILHRYADYDANRGDLPDLVKELYDINLLRMIYTFSDDAHYFVLDFFEENLNKEHYLFHALNLASQNRNTRLATELLFSVEHIHFTQQSAWAHYLKFRDSYAKLPQERRKLLHNETLRRVVSRYDKELAKRGMKNIDDINEMYLEKREQVLETILTSSPENYRRKDALFLKAYVQWQQAEMLNKPALFEDAVKIFKSINSKANDDRFKYREVVKRIQAVINGGSLSSQVKRQISDILRSKDAAFALEKALRERRLLYPVRPGQKKSG